LESINRRLTCPDSWLNDSLFKNEVLKWMCKMLLLQPSAGYQWKI
jgi:hypothetical protein